MGRARKKAEREGRTLVFIDEAGFYLLPAAVTTYAPRGQTPLLRVPLSRDHLSVIAAITPAGELYTAMQAQAFKGPDIVRFLKHLLRRISGKLLVIWDGLPAHRGQAVKDFLRSGGAKRLHLERLPGYAPELNPAEGIWQYLKYVELRNVCCKHLLNLRLQLRQAIGRLRRKTSVIRSCVDRVYSQRVL